MTQFNPLSSDEKYKDESFNPQRVFWAAIIFTLVALSSFVFALFLLGTTSIWQVYAILAITMIALGVDVYATWLVWRGEFNQGLKLFYWSLLTTVPVNVLLVTNTTYALVAIILVAGSVHVFYLMPRSWRNSYRTWPIVISLLMVVTEILNPPFRATLINQTETSSYWGPIMLGLLVISLVVMIVSQSRSGISQLWRASIRNRLTAIVAGSAIIPVVLVSIILGVATYYQVKNSLTEEAFNKLAAVQTIKANQITSYLEERKGDMEALSNTMSTQLSEARNKMDSINALKRDQIVQLFETWDADVRDVASDPGVVTGVLDLTTGIQGIGADQARLLYLGQDDLVIAPDGSVYSSAHYEQHSFFKGYIAIHGYEDALLIDPAGNVVYSVGKMDVFGTNLLTGTYKDSNLAGLYKSLLMAKAGTTYIADVASFEGSNAMFIGTPIYDGSNFVGILAYELPLNKINRIMTERTGLGETADTYLIAREDDGRITYRSDRTIVGNGEYVIGYDLTAIAPPFMRDALDGNSGGGLVVGSVGETVINAYRPLGVEGLNWAVLARITASEAFSPTRVGEQKDFLTYYREAYGYYDIFLIEPGGTIFYSVAREAEYKTNILTGEHKDTNLGSMVAEVLESTSFEFVDFAPYAPSGGKPAAFFGIPVLNENNEIQMVVATQASQAQLASIMAETTGLGETGETFIVGPDKLRRTETRFLTQLGAESTILNPQYKVDTLASRSVLAGESDQAIFNDYRGEQVMAVWSPVALIEADTSSPEAGLWGVIAKIDVSEALAPVNQLARAIGLVIGLAVLIIGAIAVTVSARFALGFVQPILSLTNTATQVAAGNMDLQVKTDSADEIGTLSNAFNTMTSQLRELIGSLEGRVASRTKDLATVAEVSTATATILETGKLLQAVVDLSKERFGLYHAHIYLLDEAGENLVLTAGAGEPGRIMAAEKRSIPLNREQSLVARAAREAKGVIINDVTQAPDFLPNPLLPNTRAELAVPMIVGGSVIGVYDVQSEQVGRFTEADVSVKTTLAAQVATSIQNVRSFEQAKKQADLESLVNAIGQKIQRSTSVEDTLQIAVREVGIALGASRVSANLQVARQDNGNANNN